MFQDFPVRLQYALSAINNMAVRKTLPFSVTFVGFGVVMVACALGRGTTLELNRVILNAFLYAINVTISF